MSRERAGKPLLGRTAPQMADGERERVSCVGGAGRICQPQQPGHHAGHLRLVRAPAPRHRGLGLARRVQCHRNPAPRGAHDGDRARLRGAHDRAQVVLAEHALDGDRVRAVPVQPLPDLQVESEQPRRNVVARGSAHHARADERQRPARHTVDHAKAAAGQTRVDPEHPHGGTIPFSPFAHEHVFGRNATRSARPPGAAGPACRRRCHNRDIKGRQCLAARGPAGRSVRTYPGRRAARRTRRRTARHRPGFRRPRARCGAARAPSCLRTTRQNRARPC